MKLSFAAIVGALVAAVVAKPSFTNTEFGLQEGKPFILTWTNATGPVTINLVSGPDANSLQPFKEIGTGLTGTSLTFTPSGLKSGNYAFRINDITDVSTDKFNYSSLIPYVGTGSSSASSAATTVTTSVASTASSTHTITSASTTENSTTMKTSSTRTTATTTPRPTVAPNNNNNAGQRFSSPLALVIITVAALVFFN